MLHFLCILEERYCILAVRMVTLQGEIFKLTVSPTADGLVLTETVKVNKPYDEVLGAAQLIKLDIHLIV